jgi:hypothetical protein
VSWRSDSRRRIVRPSSHRPRSCRAARLACACNSQRRIQTQRSKASSTCSPNLAPRPPSRLTTSSHCPGPLAGRAPPRLQQDQRSGPISGSLRARATLSAASADPVDASRSDQTSSDCGLLVCVGRGDKVREEVRGKSQKNGRTVRPAAEAVETARRRAIARGPVKRLKSSHDPQGMHRLRLRPVSVPGLQQQEVDLPSI